MTKIPGYGLYGRFGLACSGWLTLAVVELLPAASAPRVAAVFGFVLAAPGAAVVSLIRDQGARRGRPLDPLTSAVLTVALSLALGALITEAFLLTDSFSPAGTIAVLASLTSVFSLYPVLRDGPLARRRDHARQR